MDLSHLHELFPDADFGFSMKMREGSAAAFFQPTSSSDEILAERARWLSAADSDCAAVQPDGEQLVRSVWKLAETWRVHRVPARPDPSCSLGKVTELGRQWEPDCLLLAPDNQGQFVLQAGCVCFPSGWSLSEKMGHPLEAIHGIVPGLNPMIGSRIQTFLTKMKPGGGWRRSNWGISSSPERNQHPGRRINQMNSDTPPESMWLRIEHQVLTRLPDCDGILFGIRLENVGMPEFQQDTILRAGLRRAVVTMPDVMARYKNIEAIRPAILKFLGKRSES